MWTCITCGSKVDASFEVCWKCGTSVDGQVDPTFVRADEAPAILDPPVTEDAQSAFAVPESTVSPALVHDAELVECYAAEDRMQAHFLADELTKIGIPAMADTHEPNESLGGLASLPKVWVRVEDFPRARLWLDGYEMHHKEQHPTPEG